MPPPKKQSPAPKNKGGRPRKEINIEQLKAMAAIHCTAEECAAVFDVDADTLDARIKEHGYSGFSEFYKKHSADGKSSLRRAQWKAAQAGNVTMQIWLGKQLLGQRDRVDAHVTGSVTVNISK